MVYVRTDPILSKLRSSQDEDADRGETMMKGSRNPFEEIEELIERMSRQFEGGPFMGGMQSAPVDIVDEVDQFTVTVDLPGYERDDIDLTLSNTTLRVAADREAEEEMTEEFDAGRFIRRERRRDAVSRVVRLPDDVDESGVKAVYKNGVLTVSLPKAEMDESQQIEIE